MKKKLVQLNDIQYEQIMNALGMIDFIATLSITTLVTTIECKYAERPVLYFRIVMLNVIMLSVVAPFKELPVANISVSVFAKLSATEV